jgi:hypothetical protein
MEIYSCLFDESGGGERVRSREKVTVGDTAGLGG